MKRRHLLQGTAAAALSLSLARAWCEEAPNPSPFTTLNFEWADGKRQRAVPVRLYLPTPASAPQPVPLVVFSHGIGGSRAGYSYLGQHWASHGFASLHLQHVGSDRSLWFGNVFSMVSRLQDAAQESEALARVADLRFALDQVLSGELASRIDSRHIIAAGHSYGANTTLLAAGARVEREGRLIDQQDSRIKAAIVISAPPFYGEASPQKILAPVVVPSLHVTATEDIIRIPGYFSGLDDRLKVFEATGSQQKWLAVFNQGTHSGFVGRAGNASPVVVATKELSLAFLRQVLQGDGRALAAWRQHHAAIVERFVVPSVQG